MKNKNGFHIWILCTLEGASSCLFAPKRIVSSKADVFYFKSSNHSREVYWRPRQTMCYLFPRINVFLCRQAVRGSVIDASRAWITWILITHCVRLRNISRQNQEKNKKKTRKIQEQFCNDFSAPNDLSDLSWDNFSIDRHLQMRHMQYRLNCGCLTVSI